MSNVTNMNQMFAGCRSFNQPLNNWNVSNVTTMDRMFFYSTSFDQSLDDWDVINVKDMYNMFNGCPIKEENKPIVEDKKEKKMRKRLPLIMLDEGLDLPAEGQDFNNPMEKYIRNPDIQKEILSHLGGKTRKTIKTRKTRKMKKTRKMRK